MIFSGLEVPHGLWSPIRATYYIRPTKVKYIWKW